MPIEFNDFLTDNVRKIYDNYYIIPYESYIPYQSSIAAGVTSGALNLPVNYKYVKAIIICFRSQALAVHTARTLTTRAKANLVEY